MEVFMLTVYQIRQHLLVQLSQFGLDSQDWKLIRTSAKDYLIQSRAERDLVLKGRVHRQGTQYKWDFIDLLSI